MSLKIGSPARSKNNPATRGLVVNKSERFTTLRTSSSCVNLLHCNVCRWSPRRTGKDAT